MGEHPSVLGPERRIDVTPAQVRRPWIGRLHLSGKHGHGKVDINWAGHQHAVGHSPFESQVDQHPGRIHLGPG